MTPTKEEYEKACKRLEEILPITNDVKQEEDPLVAELVQVSAIIEAYEEEHYPIEEPTVKVFLDKTDTSIGAIVEGLDGLLCVADTLEELKEQVLEGIKFHLEGMREDGDPIPEVFEEEYLLSYEWMQGENHSE